MLARSAASMGVRAVTASRTAVRNRSSACGSAPVTLRARSSAAPMSARWLNACGVLPRWPPVDRSTSSASSPSGDTYGRQLLEHRRRALPLADAHQRLHQPEGADHEAALLARQAVVGGVGAVAQDQAVLGQLVRDRQHRRAHRAGRPAAGSPSSSISSTDASSAATP